MTGSAILEFGFFTIQCFEHAMGASLGVDSGISNRHAILGQEKGIVANR